MTTVEPETVDRLIVKLKIAIVVVVATCLFAAGGAVFNMLDINSVENRITTVEQTPCNRAQSEGVGSEAFEQCMQTRLFLERNQPIEFACLQFERVVLPFALRQATRCEPRDTISP